MEYVRYIGPSHSRMILADEWKAAGVTDMGSVVWDATNNFSVPVERFTDKAMEVAIHPDDAFVIMGGDQHAPRYAGAVGSLTPEQAAGAGRIDMNAALGVNRVPAWLSASETGAGGAPGGSAPTTVTTGPGSGKDS